MITIQEVRKLAMKNYNKGGDSIVECYTDEMIQESIAHGLTTEKAWLRDFATREAIYDEIMGEVW